MTSARGKAWTRLAIAGGFAVAAFVLALHTRMAWLYFQPAAGDLAALTPRTGPLFFPLWARHAVRCAGACLFFLSLPGLGRLCLPRRRADFFTSSAVALVIWSTAGFLLAAAGLARPALLQGLSAALVIAGLLAAPWREWRLTEENLPSPAVRAGLAAFALLYLLTTAVPEVFYDALVYHLAAPQAWLQAGRMTDMPDLHLWRLPGLLQPLYLWALAWSDDRLCKLLNLGLGLLTAGLIGAWAGKRWGKDAGGWAALLFLSAPMTGVNLWCCANDIPAGFFAFLALALWLEPREPGENWTPFLSGLFLGAGAAVKTTALFAAPFFALALAARLRREGRGALKPAALFALGFVLPLSPWWIRTGLWTGNPFFPQATALLGGGSPADLALVDSWKADAGGESGLAFRALAFVREGLRGVENGRFGFLGPLLLMLLPLGFFLRPDPVHGVLAGYSLAAYALFTLSTGRLRYYIPHMPGLFALAGVCLSDYARGVGAFPEKKFARFGPALKALAGVAVALNFLWLVLVFQRFNQGWPVVWGRLAAEDYMRQEHIGVYGNPSQGAFDALRESGAQGRLFVIGEARTFGSPLPAQASGTFNVPAFAPLAGDPPSAEALLARLRAAGFSHLLINVEEMKRITPEAYRGDAHLRALGTLFDGLAPPLYRDRWCILFDLRPKGPAVSAPATGPAPSAGPGSRR